ncbi:MAG: cation diffusion facilitator family transporter [Candidatus Micrarchaeota archaeon]|nr:cation diffusion facilitator family transporter [Candidatus Micrarchaeota archaeon]
MEHKKDALIGKNLGIALAITSAVFLLEVAGGVLSNSLALLSDAGHMASDVLSIAVSFAAFRIALRPPRTRRTFGYHRTEVFAAAFNGFSLVLITLLIVYEAFQRFTNPPAVNAFGMLSIAVVGLAANLWVVVKLRGHENLNVKSAYLHAFGDAVSSIGVIVAGALIALTGNMAIDLVASLVIAAIILTSSYRLLRGSLRILFEFSPPGLTQKMVEKCIKGARGVRGVHDVHVWSICSDIIYVTAHATIDDSRVSRTACIYEDIDCRLRKELGISHATIQFETRKFACGRGGVCEVKH